MKLDKTRICVFIENEAQLQQAREVLERYNQPIYDDLFELDSDERNILIKNDMDEDWFVSDPDCLNYPRTEITLAELEEILKGEKDESRI